MRKTIAVFIILLGTGCIQTLPEEHVEGLSEHDGLQLTINADGSEHDGLQLTINADGIVESLGINGEELISTPSEAFWIRDFTPDYEIDNLIMNPGFEEDSNGDGIADGWAVNAVPGGSDIALDDSVSHEGSKSVKMTANLPHPHDQNIMIYESESVTVTPDTEYLLSVYVKSDFGYFGSGISVYCRFYDGNRNEITKKLQIHRTMHSWKRFSKIIVSPSNAEEAKVALVFKGFEYTTMLNIDTVNIWFDDVLLGKMPGETKMKPVIGSASRGKDVTTYEGTYDGLQVTAEFRLHDDYIEINGEITTIEEAERAFDIYFLLPVDMTGWTWWKDIRNTEEIDSGIYEEVINADRSGDLPLSVYPLSAVTNTTGLSLAVPLSKPRIYRIFYDSNIKKYGVSFSFGLSPEGASQTADFTLYMYACDPNWGFRDALDKYYTFFPQYFEEDLDPAFLNAEGQYSDFGIRLIQGRFSHFNSQLCKELQEYNADNVYVFEYTLPFHFGPLSDETIDEQCPNYEKFVKLIDYYATAFQYSVDPEELYRTIKAKGAQSSVIYDTNNDKLLGDIKKGSGVTNDKWMGKFPLNCDPDLPGYNIVDATMFRVVGAFENAEECNAVLNGVQLDNFMNMSRYIDMEKSRFSSAQSLTYNSNTFEPGIHAMVGVTEFLQYLSDWLNRNAPHARITGNCIERGVSQFGFPYLAAFPFEMNSVSNWNFNDTELNYRRSMAYHRMVMAFQTGEMCIQDEEMYIQDEYTREWVVNMPLLQDYFHESIFYGVYPLMPLGSLKNCNFKSVQEQYQEIIFIADELYIAGWEPLTYAHTDNEKISVERFGSDRVCITVRNFDKTTEDYTLVIQQELGIGSNPAIIELFSQREILYTYDNGIIIDDSLEPFETKVFQVTSSSQVEILRIFQWSGILLSGMLLVIWIDYRFRILLRR